MSLLTWITLWSYEDYYKNRENIYRYLYFKEWTEVDYNLIICSNRNQTCLPTADTHSHTYFYSVACSLWLQKQSTHACFHFFFFFFFSFPFSWDLHTATTSQLPSAFFKGKILKKYPETTEHSFLQRTSCSGYSCTVLQIWHLKSRQPLNDIKATEEVSPFVK